ncbi:MAG: RagB/SusD family nutrient uptake outer membrane protein [Draconibacterium sp.]|nr:RagB/SusD family nutrient uptake outer membrane protein [Draconibacterium sp.]
MKKIIILIATVAFFTACNDLDLNPLSEGSSSTWYSNESEINMALNDLYRGIFWPQDGDDWTDDWTERNNTTPISGGTINGEWGKLTALWKNTYKVISRANIILANIEKVKDELPPSIYNAFEAEARFVRAYQYAYLISHWGDVIYYTKVLDLDESFTLSRTNKNTIKEAVYEDYNFAVANLPDSYGSSELKRATKGAALAMKARIALYMGDYSIARKAAEDCMDLEIYTLYPNFEELFQSKTKNPKEAIFSIPQSAELNMYFTGSTKMVITRNAGGWCASNPSWELWCSYLCTDGLPIDESPLFNPREPFKNRDPRCTMSIVEFQSRFLGFIYQPHPDSLKVWNFNSGKYQYNNDTRSNKQYASYNAMVWRKKVDEDWLDRKAEFDRILMRYADVLLMYAEASIELGQIDQTVLDAINMVRARAYGVDKEDTNSYPAIVSTDQAELRKIVRMERRMEFAYEGLRYMDIIRWGLAEKVLNTNIYGMLDPIDLKAKVVDSGLWFFAETPQIDEDGVADFDPMYNDGYIKLLGIRQFDASRQYLWPIPTKEILINDNLVQNPGY